MKNMQMANNHIKKWSASLIVREMQMKTARHTISHPLRWVLIKNLQSNSKKWKIISAGEDVKKLEILCTDVVV